MALRAFSTREKLKPVPLAGTPGIRISKSLYIHIDGSCRQLRRATLRRFVAHLASPTYDSGLVEDRDRPLLVYDPAGDSEYILDQGPGWP